MVSVSYFPKEINIKSTEGVLNNSDFVLECKYFGSSTTQLIVVKQNSELYGCLKKLFTDDLTILHQEVK